LEPSEPTEESEQEQPDIQADLISKQKAIEALNTLQQYFMNKRVYKTIKNNKFLLFI